MYIYIYIYISFSFVKLQQFLLSMLESRLIFLLKNELYRKKFSRNLLTASLLLLNFKKKTKKKIKAKTKTVSSFSETTTHIVSKKRSDEKEFHSDLLTNK